LIFYENINIIKNIIREGFGERNEGNEERERKEGDGQR
jgi:hypothetical protein